MLLAIARCHSIRPQVPTSRSSSRSSAAFAPYRLSMLRYAVPRRVRSISAMREVLRSILRGLGELAVERHRGPRPLAGFRLRSTEISDGRDIHVEDDAAREVAARRGGRCPKMLIGLEDAHVFYVSNFGSAPSEIRFSAYNRHVRTLGYPPAS